MSYKKIICIFTFILGLNALLCGQNPPINFHHLTVENGLNDGHIQMIGQDRFGYMWFGSLGALNRYDGRQIRTYAYRAGDSTSPLSPAKVGTLCAFIATVSKWLGRPG